MSRLNRPESGKRRSFAQRVGADGELAFRILASDHGLVPTKVEEDFGTDFWCQVDLEHASRGSSAVSTTVVGACVRATTSDNGIVHLSPGDAKHLLSSGTPLVFVLVHLTSGLANSPSYHRLIDGQFIAEMHEFLKSGRAKMQIAPHQCKPSDQFRASIDQMLEHGYASRVQVAVAERGVNTVLPNTNVHVRTGADGQLTLVSTVDYYSLFERVDEGQERLLLHAAFGAEEYAAARIAELSFRSDVIEYLTSLPKPLLFAGSSQEMSTKLRVLKNEFDISEPFTFRAIGTHSGYVHDAGVSLIFSEARDHNGHMVHETEVYIDQDVSVALEDLPTALDFFRRLSGGAKVFRGDQDPQTAPGFDVHNMFPGLESLAKMIEGWHTCRSVNGWPERMLEWRDIANRDAFNTIVGFADILNSSGAPVASIAFDSFESDPDDSELKFAEVEVLLPVVGNLRSHTVILTLALTGQLVSRNGESVGLELGPIIAAEFETRQRVDKSTPYPEIVASVHAPTKCYGRDIQGTLPSGLDDLCLEWSTERGHFVEPLPDLGT